MRPIKFRGRAIETGRDVKIGEYVFGDLRIVGIRPHIYKEAHCYYEEELIEVEPDSVAQLVGYDKNGKEVYEGDTVIWNDLPMTAKFITNISGGEVLKEDDQ